MDYRFLGRTGVKVSALCLGTMAFGDKADAYTSAAMFEAALDAGINFFDTADVYGEGRSEEILGKLCAPVRDRVVIATKGYFPTDKSDVNARGSSRRHLVQAVEASLRRLATDRIDIYYLHRFDDHTALDETLRAMEDLVRSGKVLYPAVSNFAAWQAARALGVAERMGWARIVCVQPMYNLVKRQAEVEILPMAATEGLSVFPYSPLGAGLLTGRYSQPGEDGRLRESDMYRTRYLNDSNLAVAKSFVELADKWGVSPVVLALAWVSSHPAVTAPILGPRDVEQLTAMLPAADYELSAEQRAELSALSPAPPPATDRNEETAGHSYVAGR